MMGSVDPSLDFWLKANSQQMSDLAQKLAQQQQQSYAQMDASKMQASHSFGWHDPQSLYGTPNTDRYVHVFGGTDPQRAYTEIPNDYQAIVTHALNQNHVRQPIKARTKIIVLFGFGIVLLVVPVILKIKGVL